MRMEDLILVSVDDHLVEPPDMFKGRLAAKFQEEGPHFITRPNGTNAWVFEGQERANIALNSVAGRRREEYGAEPTRIQDLRKGTYDVHARIEDMNANGQLAGLSFGSFCGGAGATFFNARDKDLGLAVIEAYNNWHIEDWCGAYPGRLIPLAILPLWDPELSAAEIRRVKAKGCNAIAFPPNPSKAGFGSLHSSAWDPVWRACDELGVAINMHITDASMAVPSLDSPVDVFITNMPVTLYSTASDLLFSPVLRSYRNIRFALSEGGSGWIPHFLERADFVYDHHRAWTHQDFGDRRPSEVFREHVYNCFIVDKTGVDQRHAIGVDRITWECDYPHSDSTWPESPETLWAQVKDIPDEDIEKIAWRNACRLFNFDPFQNRAKSECTVGALRAQAAHVDLSFLHTEGRGMPEGHQKGKPVPWSAVLAQMADGGVGRDVKVR
jgi:predicted TIM-barrel fold metal-dependent hydrolase